MHPAPAVGVMLPTEAPAPIRSAGRLASSPGGTGQPATTGQNGFRAVCAVTRAAPLALLATSRAVPRDPTDRWSWLALPNLARRGSSRAVFRQLPRCVGRRRG